jgi:hypothetical protein
MDVFQTVCHHNYFIYEKTEAQYNPVPSSSGALGPVLMQLTNECMHSCLCTTQFSVATYYQVVRKQTLR